MAGDPYQLGPVAGKTLWPRKNERELTVKELIGRDDYLEHDQFFELSMEPRNFGPFYAILSRLRDGESTQDDIDLLNKRVLKPQGQVSKEAFKEALLVVGTTREAVMHNEAMLLAACQAANSTTDKKRSVRV